MIQDAATGAPVLDQTVSIQVRASVDPQSKAWLPPCCSMQRSSDIVAATHEAAQNKLLYAGNVLFPTSGSHDVIVRIGGEGGEFIDTTLDVQPPAAPVSSYWAYLAAPPFLIVLFAMNQRLRRRR
jgi:hypothetical protein